MNTNNIHIPVLLEESIEGLALEKTDIVLDATIGFGGHSERILQKIPEGLLYGVDQDESAITYCKEKFKNIPNIRFIHQRFDYALNTAHLPKFNKILVDLGMSSFHLDRSGRGFSFLQDEPLDMRMNTQQTLTAAYILNQYPPESLIEIFKSFGELYHPERFVNQLITFRSQHPFAKTSDLIFCIKKGFYFHNKRSLFMRTQAQVFQALRIAVNEELSTLTRFLNQLASHLEPNNRVAIISFHSLEDRLVKQFQKSKVIKASQAEIKLNPRAHSAKLRLLSV